MTSWRTYEAAGLRFRAPDGLVASAAVSIDSQSATFTGPGVTVLIDSGPFSDRLDGYESKRGFERSFGTVAGEDATMVKFITEDGSTIVGGARIHATPSHPALTLVVQVEQKNNGTVVDAVIQSVKLATGGRQ